MTFFDFLDKSPWLSTFLIIVLAVVIMDVFDSISKIGRK